MERLAGAQVDDSSGLKLRGNSPPAVAEAIRQLEHFTNRSGFLRLNLNVV